MTHEATENVKDILYIEFELGEDKLPQIHIHFTDVYDTPQAVIVEPLWIAREISLRLTNNRPNFNAHWNVLDYLWAGLEEFTNEYRYELIEIINFNWDCIYHLNQDEWVDDLLDNLMLNV